MHLSGTHTRRMYKASQFHGLTHTPPHSPADVGTIYRSTRQVLERQLSYNYHYCVSSDRLYLSLALGHYSAQVLSISDIVSPVRVTFVPTHQYGRRQGEYLCCQQEIDQIDRAEGK